MTQNNIKEFDEYNFNDVLREYATYRKSYGLLTAGMCHLPVVKRGFIVSGYIEDDAIPYLKEKYGNVIMCRTDAPSSAWYKIPRGRDIKVETLKEHYIDMLSYSSSEIVLLCFQHPSVYFTGKFIERWNISGGANILILWGEQIIIEYVGKGFDVGDLTRGITSPHQRFAIPWSIRNHNIMTIWENVNKECIGKEGYNYSCAIRQKTLQKMGYKEEKLKEHIPGAFCPISFTEFKELYRECVSPVLAKKNMFIEEKNIAILINIYENAFHVFEIWE